MSPSSPRPAAEAVPALPEIERILAAAGGSLPGLLEQTETRLAEVARADGDELGLHASQTLAAGGKRLRPLLVFVCAGPAAGGSGPTGALVSAGAAVELVHMAALVHDDVLDRAALRRGRPTVYETAGRGAATATGDFLFSQAFAELASTGSAEAVRTLSAAASALARGELMQRADAWSSAVTLERYLTRCTLKTARLFDAACRLGAIFGDLGKTASESLGSYGARVGLAFQVFDDVLDVTGPTERTGKPRGTDLLDGTATLPLIVARDRDDSIGALDLRSLSTTEEAERLCERIAATGALDEAREYALSHVAAAKAALEPLSLPDGRRRALELVADGVVERYG